MLTGLVSVVLNLLNGVVGALIGGGGTGGGTSTGSL